MSYITCNMYMINLCIPHSDVYLQVHKVTATFVYYVIRNLIMYCLNFSLFLQHCPYMVWGAELTFGPKTAPRIPLHTRMYCGATDCGLDREWVQKQRLRMQSAWRQAPRPGLLWDVAGLMLGCVLVLWENVTIVDHHESGLPHRTFISVSDFVVQFLLPRRPTPKRVNGSISRWVVSNVMSLGWSAMNRLFSSFTSTLGEKLKRSCSTQILISWWYPTASWNFNSLYTPRIF